MPPDSHNSPWCLVKNVLRCHRADKWGGKCFWGSEMPEGLCEHVWVHTPACVRGMLQKTKEVNASYFHFWVCKWSCTSRWQQQPHIIRIFRACMMAEHLCKLASCVLGMQMALNLCLLCSPAQRKRKEWKQKSKRWGWKIENLTVSCVLPWRPCSLSFPSWC